MVIDGPGVLVMCAAPCNSKDKLLFIIIEVIVRYMYFQRLVVAGLKLRSLNMIGWWVIPVKCSQKPFFFPSLAIQPNILFHSGFYLLKARGAGCIVGVLMVACVVLGAQWNYSLLMSSSVIAMLLLRCHGDTRGTTYMTCNQVPLHTAKHRAKGSATNAL